MGIKRQCEALVPHVRTMTLLPVVLLSLLQGSFTKTVKTVLPQYTFEKFNDCLLDSSKKTQATSLLGCAGKMIGTHYHGFSYSLSHGRITGTTISLLETRFTEGIINKEVRWAISIIDGIFFDLLKSLFSPSIRTLVLLFVEVEIDFNSRSLDLLRFVQDTLKC